MRTSTLLVIVSLFFYAPCFGQEKNNATLKSPYAQYDKDRTWTVNRKNGVKNDSTQNLFNPKMLNILFANKVGTAFGGSNDLSLQKFYASLDANDKSISLGTNFDSRRGSELDKLDWIFSAGVKIKAKDKFATLYKDGDFQEDNIGATFKVTFIGNGTINFTSHDKSKDDFKKREQAIEANREFLKKKYEESANDFNEKKLKDFKAYTAKASQFDSDIKDLDSSLKKMHDAAYIELAKEEIKYIEDAKMYRFIRDYWYSLAVFVPFGENTYRVTPDYATALKKERFYAFNLTGSFNMMQQYSCGTSLFFKAEASFKNNNNIMVDNLESVPFQTTTLGANNTLIVTDSSDGYKTDYNEFTTTSLKIEPAIFVLNNTIGFSPAIEFNAGEYNKINWKFGIPVSFKDKDGKPKVNFEIQWKEVNTFKTNLHLVGISANFLFGDLIN